MVADSLLLELGELGKRHFRFIGEMRASFSQKAHYSKPQCNTVLALRASLSEYEMC